MAQVLDASRICNGSYGKVYIDGEWQSNVNECTATEEVGSQPCRSVSQGVDTRLCLPKTAWPPT